MVKIFSHNILFFSFLKLEIKTDSFLPLQKMSSWKLNGTNCKQCKQLCTHLCVRCGAESCNRYENDLPWKCGHVRTQEMCRKCFLAKSSSDDADYDNHFLQLGRFEYLVRNQKTLNGKVIFLIAYI